MILLPWMYLLPCRVAMSVWNSHTGDKKDFWSNSFPTDHWRMSKCAVLWQVLYPASSCCSETPKEVLNHQTCWGCSPLSFSLSKEGAEEQPPGHLHKSQKELPSGWFLGAWQKQEPNSPGMYWNPLQMPTVSVDKGIQVVICSLKA